jgi:cyclopropane-fatty-acyl-phospholipid synthase
MSESSADLAAQVARQVARLAARRVDVRFEFPDGSAWGPARGTAPVLALHSPAAFYQRLAADRKMAFGEAYVAGEWAPGPDTDLADLLVPFAARLADLVPAPLRRLRGVIDRRLPGHTANTREGARSNIASHYDMSNDLFAAFLDPSMTYSSAWFDERAMNSEPLEAAQRRKIDGILDFAQVTAGTRVLEIGSGWGSLAIRAAERGARVTSVTLSAEQAELANERIKDRRLDDLVSIELCDYRDVAGTFDAVVSIEMIEAVGEEYWPAYFRAIDGALAPGGRVAIQAIMMSHQRLEETRDSYGWIHKHIFPGGVIPSMQAIEDVCAADTSLRVTDRRELGVHYAQTLRRWRNRFCDNWPAIRELGFDMAFRRTWEFYLAYCEAGFRSRYLTVSQLRLARVTDGLGR